MAILSERSYKNISIKNEFAEAIEKFIRQNPQLGYRSIAAFLEDSSRRRIEELKAIEDQLQIMWHMNLNDKGVLVWDPDLGRAVQILFSPKGITCEEDGEDDCEHIQFALSKPDIQEVIRRKIKEGWRLPDV